MKTRKVTLDRLAPARPRIPRLAVGPTLGSPRRFVLLGGPGGYLTVLAAGSPLLEKYGGWTTLLRVNVPRRKTCRTCVEPHLGAPALRVPDAAKRWALDVYGSEA